MAPVSTPDRGDSRRMARGREPVMHGGPNPAALQRRFALALMSRNQQQNALPGGNRALQSKVDRLPGAIEVVAVQIEHPVRIDPTAAETPIPTAVERRMVKIAPRRRSRFRRPCLWNPSLRLGRRRNLQGCGRWIDRVAREWPDRRRDLGPQLRFLSGQAAHGRPFPGAAGSVPAPWPTFRPRSAALLRPRPRRCRSGWRP